MLQGRHGGSWRAGGTGTLQQYSIKRFVYVLCHCIVPWSWRSRGSCGSRHPRAEHPRPAGLRGDVSGWAWWSPTMQGPAFDLTLLTFELPTISAFPAGAPQDICGSAPWFLTWFSSPLPQMPGGRCSPCHPTTAARSLPVPLRPSFLFREQRMHLKRELTPPLCTPNQPLPFANFCFFQKKPAKDHGLSGGERPGLRGRGNGSSGTEGRAPPASSPPLLLFPTFRERTADAPAWSSPGIRPAGDGAQR